jgi:hypothetical protein
MTNVSMYAANGESMPIPPPPFLYSTLFYIPPLLYISYAPYLHLSFIIHKDRVLFSFVILYRLFQSETSLFPISN